MAGMHRDERGAGLVLVGVWSLVLGLLTVLAVTAGAALFSQHRVAGAADLVALAGATAHQRSRLPCDAARRAADANGVTLAGCEVVGDDEEFVVSIEATITLDWGPVRVPFSARSYAGVVTDPGAAAGLEAGRPR